MQLRKTGGVVDALAINSNDASRWTALVQNSQCSDDRDDSDDIGAPAAATYKGHGGFESRPSQCSSDSSFLKRLYRIDSTAHH